MSTSVRVKASKKQSPFTRKTAEASPEAEFLRRVEQAACALEEAVFDVLATDKGHFFHDVDFLYWNRKLKNIATPISLALAEYRGPRCFHYHFRHDPRNHDTLYPVVGPRPVDTLARVCRESLTYCSELVGVQDSVILKNRDRLESALRAFLRQWQAVPKPEVEAAH